MNAVEDHAVGVVVVGDSLQILHILAAGGHIIRCGMAVPEGGIQFIEIQIAVVRQFFDAFDPIHSGTPIILHYNL